MTSTPVLELRDVRKWFGSIVALRGVSFDVREDEVVGLVGDNGAGKSTLIKIMSGNFPPDAGEVYVDGKPARFKSPGDARAAGIETVYQGLSLCENLDSAANLFIGREIYKKVLGVRVLQNREMAARATETLSGLGLHIPSVNDRVEYLSGGERQSIALARSISWGTRLVLLDEPTAALGVRETARALAVVDQIRRERKVSMILISHNLQHVFQIADRIVVLRHGEVIGIRERRSTTPGEIVSMITGAALVEEAAS
jgi:D-xylose transport system ATP-binding protein